MKLITRHTRAPRSGAFIRCPYCQEVSLVHHFSWTALTCQHCSESVDKYCWAYCDRSEVDPVSILRLGSPVTLRDGDEWATWMPAGDCVISMYGTGGHTPHTRNRLEGRIQLSREVALQQVQTHLEYGWTMDARGKGVV
jgi:hypothetical protein